MSSVAGADEQCTPGHHRDSPVWRDESGCVHFLNYRRTIETRSFRQIAPPHDRAVEIADILEIDLPNARALVVRGVGCHPRLFDPADRGHTQVDEFAWFPGLGIAV